MKTSAERDTIKTITTYYIDGAFVESHGREVMDIIRPTDGQVIARVTLADEEDTRRAIAAARRAFATYGRSTKDERAKILHRLHEAASARLGDHSTMVGALFVSCTTRSMVGDTLASDECGPRTVGK
jgi:aldehyde dehydrogenase (NAD+)